jgi:2-methylcitrate dehydratase PrpD
MEITKKLAEFVRAFRFSDIPQEAVEHCKKCMLDCLGSGLGGVGENASRLAIEYVSELGGKPQASVIGTDLKTDVANASLVNGVIAHALDFDDYHGDTVIHATASCLPSILAIAEDRHLSGSDILAALIIGIDISVRLGLGLGSYHYELGWHATSTAGRFGATAGAAKLLNLNTDQIINAFGIAGTQAAGVRQVFGTMTKPFNAGKACMDGVISALLAEKGFTSSDSIIEGELGILDVMTDRPNKAEILGDLGSKLYVTEISFKPYPTCA